MTTSNGYPTKEELEEAVSAILYADGPDQHIDGYDVIAQYILAVIERTDKAWLERYLKRAPAASRFGDFKGYFKRARGGNDV